MQIIRKYHSRIKTVLQLAIVSLLTFTVGLPYIFLVLATLLALHFLYKIILRKIFPVNFSGKTVWVTGASSGIGRALAIALKSKGASLVLSARNIQQLKKVKGQLGQDVIIVKMDMANFKQVKEETQKVMRLLGDQGKSIDIIIQNAGVSMRSYFNQYSFENHLYQMDVNVNGIFAHLKQIFPYMAYKQKGQVVGISSISGKVGVGIRSTYSASKHALVGLLDSLRSQFSQYNIKVTCINPGYVKTNLPFNALTKGKGQTFKKSDANIENGMPVEQFAQAAVQSIFYQESEANICEKIHLIPVLLRNVFPELTFWLMQLNFKLSQKQVMEAAQNK